MNVNWRQNLKQKSSLSQAAMCLFMGFFLLFENLLSFWLILTTFLESRWSVVIWLPRWCYGLQSRLANLNIWIWISQSALFICQISAKNLSELLSMLFTVCYYGKRRRSSKGKALVDRDYCLGEAFIA